MIFYHRLSSPIEHAEALDALRGVLDNHPQVMMLLGKSVNGELQEVAIRIVSSPTMILPYNHILGMVYV